MSFEDLTVEHLDEVNKVVEKYLAGTEPTQISKELAMPRQKVVAYINEWRAMAADNAAIRAPGKARRLYLARQGYQVRQWQPTCLLQAERLTAHLVPAAVAYSDTVSACGKARFFHQTLGLRALRRTAHLLPKTS